MMQQLLIDRLERRVRSLEDDMAVLKALIQSNNESIESLLTAVQKEKESASAN